MGPNPKEGTRWDRSPSPRIADSACSPHNYGAGARNCTMCDYCHPLIRTRNGFVYVDEAIGMAYNDGQEQRCAAISPAKQTHRKAAMMHMR